MKNLILTLLVVVLAATCLMGNRAYSGDSFSYTSGDQAIICDHSRDGTNAYVVFGRRGSSGSHYAKDGNGTRAGCGVSGHGNRITDHKTCKASPFSSFPRCGHASHH
jgi:hypothetical protein